MMQGGGRQLDALGWSLAMALVASSG